MTTLIRAEVFEFYGLRSGTFPLDHLSLRADSSDTNAERVKDILLSMTFEFKSLATPEACFLCQVNLREYIAGLFAVAARSAVQRIMELIGFRDRKKNKLAHNELANAWASEVSMSSISEKVTADFVRNATNVYDNLLKHADIARIIMTAEHEWGKQSPFDSVYKLAAVASKCTSAEQSIWVCASIVDAVKNGFVQAGEFSVRMLSGKGAGNHGFIDLCLQKLWIYKYISTDFLSQHKFSSDTMSKIHEMSCHDNCRVLFGFKTQKAANMAWLGTLPESGWKLCTLVENVCYCTTYDTDLKTLAKDGKSVREIMEEAPMKERLDELLEALENESSKGGQTMQPSTTTEDTTIMSHILCVVIVF